MELTIDGDIDRLPERYQTCVYRVVQEALTNSVRHAQARAMAVSLSAGHGSLDICVMDDGVGFEPRERRDGLGLRGIGERVREIGGTLTIDSAPGRGTILVLSVPMPATATETEERVARVAG